MKAHELRGLTAEELVRRLGEEKASLFTLRMQVGTGQLDNVSRMGQVRREIARIKTVQLQQAAAEEEETDA